MSTTKPLVAVLAAAALGVAAVPAALGKDGDLRVPGVCTKSSTAKLKLSPENGRIEVELEVDQNRNGVPWKVTLRRNGAFVVSTRAVTKAPSGSFEVRRVLQAGRIVAVATSPSGERCSASASM